MGKVRYWDIFYNGSWVGMTQGETLDAGKELVKRSMPNIYESVKYAEWFGRLDPRNCRISGGKEPNPT